MEALLPFFFKALMALVGVFGGATALENMLENAVMSRVPVWVRWMVTPVVSFIFAIVTTMAAGGSFGMGLAAGLALWARTVNVHNDPKSTSADWALPAPPEDALGIPGLLAIPAALAVAKPEPLIVE